MRRALALTGRPFGHGLGGVEFFGGFPFAQGADAAAQTPARAVVVLDYRRPLERDTDVDGILDLRDRCVREPEDVDLVADGDGCPESDADGDGIGDGPDVCPDASETWNEHLDEDGCPDRVMHVDLLVRGVPDVPSETAIVDGVGPESATVMVGEVARMKDLGGTHSFSVAAEGCRPYQGELSAVEGDIQLVVDLEPIRYGRVLLRLVDATGKGLPGWVWRPGVEGGAPEAVEGEGTAFRAETRTQSWTVYAAGHAARVVPVEPVQSGDLVLTVTLQASDVRVEGDQLRTDRSLPFDLDRAELRPEALPVLDDIVALLLARPDIELVRVEGHADESGTSRHNLELSRARPGGGCGPGGAGGSGSPGGHRQRRGPLVRNAALGGLHHPGLEGRVDGWGASTFRLESRSHAPFPVPPRGLPRSSATASATERRRYRRTSW